ncbi:MAG: DUF3810 domain-containing protein [Butyrivibrio sp.]|nr:DUF3810 domain-containing protein [Butyrivibrio sp.]
MKKNLFSIVLITISVIILVLSWVSTGFADAYTDHVFPVITQSYACFTSIFPFSVGELLLLLGVIIIFSLVVYMAAELFLFLLKKRRGRVIKTAAFMIGRILPNLLSVVMLIMVLNCFVLYHCSPIKAGQNAGSDHSLSELTELRDYLVNKCNVMAADMERDKDGSIIYTGDMQQQARLGMEKLKDKYKRLDGFYALPKPLTFSWFMSQQYMQGYYFPFSMEANYNDYMYIANKPFTMCHELAHTHGYIYEDEANFLGFLGCILSGDEFFEYSGYLGILIYVNNDFYSAVGRDEYNEHVSMSDDVKYDLQFLTDSAWEKVERESFLDTETVKKAADTFIDTNLKVNGVSSGKVSYSHVVSLLMDYYAENPYNQG